MAEYVGQSISHALIALGVVEALLRLWRVREPDLRVAFRLLPLAFPVLVLPAFLVLAPGRTAEAFRERWAFFAGARWADVEVLGVRVDRALLAALGLLGGAILALDLVRMRWARREALVTDSPLPAECTGALVEEVSRLALRLGVRAPRVRALDTPVSVLLVAGLRRPALVISRGALERLDARERSLALAHELAHLARRDLLLGWLLLACRMTLCFNPAAQVAARAVVRELERRADDLAVGAIGDREALASGLAALSTDLAGERARARPGSPVRRLAVDVVHRGELAAIAERRRRLAGTADRGGAAFGGLRLAATAAALGALLFFVV